MYLLTDARAIAALAERARAGCDVRVILEPAPYLNEDANQAAYAELTAAGAVVRWSTPRFSFTHAKTLIVDHARLVVMTLNLTGAGIGGNREYAAVDDDAADIAAAEAVFAADETGDLAGAAGRVITSPDASRAALTGLIEQAAQSLAIEAEELTDPAIVGRAARRARAGRRRHAGLAGTARTRAPPSRSWPRRARRCAPSPTPRSTPRSWLPTRARSTSAPRTSRPPRSTGTASSACGSTTPTSRGASPRPWRTTPPAASHRRRAGAARRYIAVVWPTEIQSTAAAARVRLRRRGAPPDKTDRKAYLEEQIQRQKRGEPIDVEWVTEELQRIRREQIARIQTSQRNLRWIVTGAAVLMLVLWARSGGVFDRGGFVTLGLVVIGLLAAFALRRGPRA